MKAVLRCILFLVIASTFALISGCSTQVTETEAMRADLAAMQQSITALRDENTALLSAVTGLENQLTQLNQQLTAVPAAEPEQVAEPLAEVSLSPEIPEPSPVAAGEVAEPAPSLSATAKSVANELTYPAPTPEPQPTPAESSPQYGEQKLYITATGSKYHYDPECNGGTYFESTMEEALAKGLTPCKRCAGG